MSKKAKIFIYVLFVLAVYLGILFTNVMPSMVWKVVRGPNAGEKKIQEFVIQSEYQRAKTKIRVLLPEEIDENRHYPVLYLLPSVPQLLDPWWNSALIEIIKYDIANKYQIICVAPTFSDMPWYADHPADREIWQETYFLNTVIPYVDKNFPTIPSGEGRYLFGYSKSGTGAFSLKLRHPNKFNKALSWDAPMLFDFKNIPGSGLKKVYGNKENFMKYHIPSLFIQNSHEYKDKSPKFILMGFSEHWDAIHKVHELMSRKGIPHIYDNDTQSLHNWHSGWFQRGIKLMFNDDDPSRKAVINSS